MSPLVLTLITTNAGTLLINDVAKNEEFMEAALTYTEELVVSAEIVRVMPKMFRPYVLARYNP